MGRSIKLIGVGAYFINPLQIAFVRQEAGRVDIHFVGGPGSQPPAISLGGEEAEFFVQALLKIATVQQFTPI